ncbi:MAG: hypothetical protein N3E36_02630 [Sulfolobales archaeon]|nr:hypothetical protein [Sulfolobales archaeon]MCX8198911.1 hypothetical protein [Sulfolobales archaeon]MDW8169889.1 hypothetical protein [Desulfurococcaceae archaeon]
MSLEELVRSVLSEADLIVRTQRGKILGIHRELPVLLSVSLRKNGALIRIEAMEDLRSALDELVSLGENAKSVVDDVLTELRNIAIDLKNSLEARGVNVSLELRSGESDVREILEEIVEEYGELIGEEELFEEE